jgi:hypothetical protein
MFVLPVDLRIKPWNIESFITKIGSAADLRERHVWRRA